MRAALLLLGLLCLLLLPARAARAANGPDPCAPARVLQRLHLEAQAHAEYAQVIAQQPALQCAIRGYSSTQAVIDRANQLAHDGLQAERAKKPDLVRARNFYISALTIDASNGAARDGLEQLQAPRPGGGKTSGPTAGGFLSGLADGIAAFVNWAAGNPTFAGRLILVVGVIVALVLWMFGALWRFFPGLRRLRQVSLNVQDFDDGSAGLKIGPAVAARVSDSFYNFSEPGSFSPYIVTGTIQQPSFGTDVAASIPQLKFLTPFLKYYRLQTEVRLHGLLQYGPGGAGLTLTLVDTYFQRIVASASIWQADFEPYVAFPAPQNSSTDPAPFFDLAEAASIWAVFHLNEYWSSGRIGMSKTEFAPLGCKGWKSYVYFRAGVKWLDRDDPARAAEMFAESLNLNTENRGALLNLGSLHIRNDDFAAAERAFRAAKRLAETHGQEPDQTLDAPAYTGDPVWYRALYYIVVALEYQSIRPDQDVLDLVDTLVCTIKRTKEKLKGTAHRSKPYETLLRFLWWFEGLAITLKATQYARADRMDEARSMIEDLETADDNREISRVLPYPVHYNLACSYTALGSCGADVSIQRRDYDHALTHLAIALERASLTAAKSWDDPSLQPLKTFPAIRERFAKLLAACAPVSKPADLPLQELRVVGEDGAKCLQAEGIVSPDDLIVSAMNPSVRMPLARRLNLTPIRLRTWARAADMMRVDGITAACASLLVECRIGSLTLLAVSDPATLHQRLLAKNRELALVEPPPSGGSVWRWVETARTLQPIVVD